MDLIDPALSLPRRIGRPGEREEQRQEVPGAHHDASLEFAREIPRT
jgi:hypothetical protein